MISWFSFILGASALLLVEFIIGAALLVILLKKAIKAQLFNDNS